MMPLLPYCSSLYSPWMPLLDSEAFVRRVLSRQSLRDSHSPYALLVFPDNQVDEGNFLFAFLFWWFVPLHVTLFSGCQRKHVLTISILWQSDNNSFLVIWWWSLGRSSSLLCISRLKRVPFVGQCGFVSDEFLSRSIRLILRSGDDSRLYFSSFENERENWRSKRIIGAYKTIDNLVLSDSLWPVILFPPKNLFLWRKKERKAIVLFAPLILRNNIKQ